MNRAPELPTDHDIGALGEGPAQQPSTEICLGEKSVACNCDPHLHRAVLVEPRNVHVTACLRCGTVTCTRMLGDDGRYHGNSWHAYWTVPVSQSIVDWLALWPRVKVTYGDSRWPMSSVLVRRDYLYYPADTRCQDSEELARLETRLIAEQSGRTAAQRLRGFEWPQTPPPEGIPDALHDFADVWEALQLRSDSDLSRLAHLAQPSNRASHLAVDLLWKRPDAFEVMVDALRSNELWHSVGFAMARDSHLKDPRLADLIIEILNALSLAPLPDVPGRVVSCGQFEALLVLIADLKLASPEMLTALETLKRRLIRHDAWLVKYIGIVLRELRGEPALVQPERYHLP